MNIFAVHEDPVIAAEMLGDQHVSKMVLESAQMLCTVAREFGIDASYKSTHVSHPCTKWVRESIENCRWLVEHARAMDKERKRRSGSNKPHKSLLVIEDVWLRLQFADIPSKKGLTPFAMAMPDKYKGKDPVTSYIKFYRHEKLPILRWKKGIHPFWNNVVDFHM